MAKRKPNTDFVCEHCGKKKRVYRSAEQIRSLGPPRFCNRACFAAYARANPKEYTFSKPRTGASLPCTPTKKVALKSRENPCRNDCPHGFSGGYHGKLCDECALKAAYLEMIEGGTPVNPSYQGYDQTVRCLADIRG